MQRPGRATIAKLAVANALILGTLGVAAVLHATRPDTYHQSVQEDGLLEWTTFFAFGVAAALYGRAALGSRHSSGAWPGFLAGLALFCGVVAMEEISWGQRLLAYRPPAYFLDHNFQQELNLHNLVEKELRKAAFLAVVLGYGVALPLLCRIPLIARVTERLGVVSPSVGTLPGFAATAVVYVAYPWSHTGEWAEAMLGFAMLASAWLACGELGTSALRLAAAGTLCVGLGFATTQATWLLTRDDPERLAAAEVELEALSRDFSGARTRTRCGSHKRVYALMRKVDGHALRDGEFAGLVARGLPEERADFFLDPWNSPYWVRHECSRDRSQRAIFVYSFGANRRRDSTDWEFVPDDPGAWISRPGSAPSDRKD